MKTKLSENARRHVGESLTIRWGTSRGRDTYGYTTCSLRNHRGQRVAGCNGGGYDMRGTVVGHWIAATFPNELRALKPEQMDEQSHWEPERARVCWGKCRDEYRSALSKAILKEVPDGELPKQEKLPEECWKCPKCGGDTIASRDGERVNDGRSFHGLRFYDPNYNAADAVLEHADGTFTKPEDVGKTLGQLQAEGKIVDLEAIRAAYKQSSPHATTRHTAPSIDGACGFESVLRILNAIGLTLEKVHDSSKLDIYVIREHIPNK